MMTLRWGEEQNACTGQGQDVVSIEGSGRTDEETLTSSLEAGGQGRHIWQQEGARDAS